MTRWDSDNLNAAHTARELQQEFGCNLVDQLREVTGGKLACTNTSNALRLKSAARIEQLERELWDFRESQHYRYIGVDGKPVLARELEDRAIKAERELAETIDEQTKLHETVVCHYEKATKAEAELTAYKTQVETYRVAQRNVLDQLSAEKALADRLYEDSLGEICSDEAYVAYRKARGL